MRRTCTSSPARRTCSRSRGLWRKSPAWPWTGSAGTWRARGRPTSDRGRRGLSQRGGRAMLFRDRFDAGRQLAEHLGHYAGRPDVIVLALPRGGVPVGYEVAQALGAPLDVFLVRKLGVPRREELAMGAIASGGVRVLNEDVLRMLPISARIIDSVAADESRELERRERLY